MNRIIIIGNGFDKAHNLPTGYTDFINHYWSDFTSKAFNSKSLPYSDGHAVFYVDKPNDCNSAFKGEFSDIDISCKNQQDLLSLISECNKRQHHICKYEPGKNCRASLKLEINNAFLKCISDRCLENWVDIENEYYEALKKMLKEDNSEKRSDGIKALNKEFDAVKKLLENYLTYVVENSNPKTLEPIKKAFLSNIDFKNEVAATRQDLYIKASYEEIRARGIITYPVNSNFIPSGVMNAIKGSDAYRKGLSLNETLILNFNYTKVAERLYTEEGNYEVVNIHGELNSKNNPIIFGYGDELDDDYKKIEKLQDNDFLENIKSIQYHKTRNYRRLLSFIESEPYQVFIMGHSCGNSDRTLLNTLFEHENCVSIKVFYQQFEDGSDDHSNLIRNISRNFNDKPRMRDVVVNWEDSSPLVPITKT